MQQFSDWLAATWLSVALQEHNAWTIPAIQSLHIIAIAIAMGSSLLIGLRVLGIAGTDQTPAQNLARYGPWLKAALWTLLVSGTLLVVAEPVRELITVSFWVKMALVIVGVLLARALSRGAGAAYVVLQFLIWIAVIFLGRLIAYDHIWGSWSPAAKA